MDITHENEMLYKEETDMIIGWAIEVHKNLGPGFLEVVYKDGLEYEVGTRDLSYSREKMYKIKYKDIYLPHHFYADFVFFDKIIVEIKAKQGGIANEDLAQTINYLKVSGCKVGLIFNFAKAKLEIRRVVF